MPFDPAPYGPTVSQLLREQRLPELGPGRPNESMQEALRALTNASLAAGAPIRDPRMLDCCRAALWLWHDYLDESHTLSQSIETPSGSYWHGILHRREPDYGNAKYWFRRVGEHPILGPLTEACATLLREHQPSLAGKLDDPAIQLIESGRWDPFRFVDLCEKVATGKSSSDWLCREVARIEWELLFDYCYRQGVDVPD